MKNNLLGLSFAALWASASVATKIGLTSGQPLIISDVRFLTAGLIMLMWVYLIKKNRLPIGVEWRQLFIYGALNVAIYLGVFVLALKNVSAGIATLSIAVNPLIISILSAAWLKRKITLNVWLGLILGLAGVLIAVYPLLQKSYATPIGLVLLFSSMFSYSVGTVYFSSIDWKLSVTTINGWQIFFGALLLLPATLYFSDFQKQKWDYNFWSSTMWLVFVVSITAVQLWLYLLKIEPVKTALWLYLCPIFGFIYAFFILNEPISVFTFIGTLLVLLGLSIGQRKMKTN